MAMNACVLLTDVVYCADVGVIKGGRSLSLALEPGQCMRIFTHIVRQQLQSDKTAEPSILSFVDDSHPAATKFFKNAVV